MRRLLDKKTAALNGAIYGWDWDQFEGSAEELKWNRRDLVCLDAIMALTPGRTAVVQAGGCLGIYPKRLAQEFRAVYTFEPSATNFAALIHNAPEANIIASRFALGCEVGRLVGTSQIRRDGKPNSHEGITHISGPGFVPTIELDALGLPAVDLLCLDLEGWEMFALRGAVQTIRRCRPVLAVEINKSVGYVGHTRDELRAFILALGYRFVERMQSDEVFVPLEPAA